ncbi:MAG: hypothetical protein ACTSU2_05145 [Promethearchaeota archaeon]
MPVKKDQKLVNILLFSLLIGILGIGSIISHDIGQYRQLDNITNPNSGTTPIYFSQSPLDTNNILTIHPLGHLNPSGGHVFPTDHIYLELKDPSTAHIVYNPGPATLYMVRNSSNTDYECRLRISDDVDFYFGHMTSINQSILDQLSFSEDEGGCYKGNVSLPVGYYLGTIGGEGMNGVCLDFGMEDQDYSVYFVHPELYPFQIHTVCPINYFEPNLKQTLIDLIEWQGTGTPSCGNVSWDVANTLSGNWFLKSAEADLNLDWKIIAPKELAFVRYNSDPSKQLISVGGTISAPAAYEVLSGPNFTDVNVNSGKIIYHVKEFEELNGENKTVLVQMTDNETLNIQIFDGHLEDVNFTNATTYDRGSISEAGSNGDLPNSINSVSYPLIIINMALTVSIIYCFKRKKIKVD